MTRENLNELSSDSREVEILDVGRLQRVVGVRSRGRRDVDEKLRDLLRLSSVFHLQRAERAAH